MTKRFKLFLTALIGAICVCCLAVGCSVGTPDKETLLAPYAGGHVTYYANGGLFNGSKDAYLQDLYIAGENVPFCDVSDDKDSTDITGIYISRTLYDFMGWYEAARYESGDHQGEVKYTFTGTLGGVTYTEVPAYPKVKDGEYVKDEHDRPVFTVEGYEGDVEESKVLVVPSETFVDSNVILDKDEPLVVCAQWKPALKFVFKLSADSGEYVYNEKTYHPGDTITIAPFGSKKQETTPATSTSVVFDGTTHVANYVDEECTTFVDNYKYNRDDYEGQTEIVVWSKYISGSWTIIRNNANKVKDMFNSLNSSNNAFYIIEDVDCSSVNTFVVCSGTRGVKAKIEGNGHTLSNLKFDCGNTSYDNSTTVAPVFGKIYSTAQISNIKLDNISITVKGKKDLTFYAVCSGVEEGATVSNVQISNIKATVTVAGKINNAQGEDRTSWIFGGKGTDEAFIGAYGITLSGTNTLTIK